MLKKLLFAPDGGVALAPAPEKPAAPAPASPPPAAAPAAPAPAAEPPPSDDPFEAPKKAPAAAAKPADGKPTQAAVAPDIDKLAPKELRERVKQLNQENQTYGGKIKALEEQIKAFDKRGIDTSALTTRLEAIEKERDGALAELRAARQEASPEFKEKFDKPFNQAAERAKKSIEELQVTDAEGNIRPATWADFAALYSLPVGKAIEQANSLFGTAANFVLQQREKLLDMDTARQTALQEEKDQFKQKSAREIAEQAKRREGVGKMWEETNKRLADSVSDYKDDPTDADANEARKHALSVFDSEINAADQEDFIKQKVLKDAHVRQRVGAYAVQKVQIARLKAEKEALQKQVDELKGVAPGGTHRAGGDAPAGEETEDWGAGLVKSVKGALK
jgi:hypothetical protein